jgi:hypothetical protein
VGGTAELPAVPEVQEETSGGFSSRSHETRLHDIIAISAIDISFFVVFIYSPLGS